jgi:hypothetical protein
VSGLLSAPTNLESVSAKHLILFPPIARLPATYTHWAHCTCAPTRTPHGSRASSLTHRRETSQLANNTTTAPPPAPPTAPVRLWPASRTKWERRSRVLTSSSLETGRTRLRRCRVLHRGPRYALRCVDGCAAIGTLPHVSVLPDKAPFLGKSPLPLSTGAKGCYATFAPRAGITAPDLAAGEAFRQLRTVTVEASTGACRPRHPR